MDASPPLLAHKLAAEALGTFVIIVTAVGVSISAGVEVRGIDPMTAAFATVAVMFALGRWSGGHFNPAVTVGSALSGRTAWKDAYAYITAQVAGAIVAAVAIVIFAFGVDGFEFWDVSLGGNGLGDDADGYALWAGLLVTLFASALIVLVYLGLTDERNEQVAFASLGMGLGVYATLALTAGATGGSVSLAQSFGLGLVSDATSLWQGLVIGIVTLIGGAAAGFAYNAIFGADREPVPGSGLDFAPKQPNHQGFAPAPGGYQQPWGQQAPGGYAAPQQAQQPGPAAYAPPAAAAAAPAPQPPVEQPIIQDGWQWDPQAQQWIPAQQQPPAAGSWSPGAGEQTQVRPTDGS